MASKRNISLVPDYGSDDEESTLPIPAEPQKKKRKLPPVPSSLTIATPINNPALHQGRKRTTPYVEGQFAAYVYVPLALDRQSLLFTLINDIVNTARVSAPTLHGIWPTIDALKRAELHVSLSRPIFLRAHQREDLKKAVKNLSRAQKPFIISFATLSELMNDEKTRVFLTMEVGAGHHELNGLSNGLTPALKAIRQEEYYVNPRFHASIAWALLCQSQDGKILESETDDSICTPRATLDDFPGTGDSIDEPQVLPSYPTISQLPPDLVTSLNEQFGDTLSSPKVGSFVAEELRAKVGKEVFSWRLLGM